MEKADGYARVITDHDGKIIDVIDYCWNHNALYNLEFKDSEVLIPLRYFYQEGKWVRDEWSDPEQIVQPVNHYVLTEGYKKKYYDEIYAAWKSENEYEQRYVDDMINDYEILYKEKIELA